MDFCNIRPCWLPLCRCNPVCNQCRSQLTEADGGQAGAGGAVEVQAQRRVPDCQCQRGPAALLPDWKTYLSETKVQEELWRARVPRNSVGGFFSVFTAHRCMIIYLLSGKLLFELLMRGNRKFNIYFGFSLDLFLRLLLRNFSFLHLQ